MAMVLEVTQGCQMGCKGCHVNKNSHGLPSDDVLMNLLSMLYELKGEGVELAEVELGATDVLSAINRNDIFEHPLISQIVQCFQVTVLNAAFVDPDARQYVELARQVNLLSPNNAVGLVTPIEIGHVFNDKYVQRIRDNVALFRDHLHNDFTEVIFSIIVDHQSLSLTKNKYTYSDLFARARELRVADHTAIDFAFHQGRLNLDLPWIRQDLLDSIHALNQQYVHDLNVRQNIERRHIPSQLLFEQEILELVFSQSELYIRPILNERLTVLHPKMRYDGPWKGLSLLQEFQAKITRNLSLSEKMKHCKDCIHVNRCSNRYTQELMQLLDTQDCVSLLPTHHGALS